MRVSTNGMYDSGTIAMLQQQDALIKTQQQISTGRRILTPAEDPIAAAQALNVSQAASINSQYSVNRSHALTSLGLVESTLQNITSNLQDVRQITVNAGNPALNDTDRKSLAIELRGHFEALLGQANITDGTGNYLFSGFQENTQPFTHKGFNVQYNGDQGQRLNQVGPSRQIAVSNSGTDVFERIKNGNGIFVTAANATNTGSGVINSGSVTAPASLTGHNYEISFSVSGSVTTYDVVDTTSGATLSSGNAFANNNTISFDGLQFSITGDPANGDKFTVSPSTNQSIFTTIGNLITALEAPSSGQPGGTQLTNNLNSALQNLDNSLENILSTRASVGSRLQEIEALESMGEDFEIQYEQRLSELRDVDFAKAISDLNRQQVYLEAAQKSFATVTGLSLFDFI
ncbi:MAG TPA: flagellar hook-associated protein FlgL [Nitrosomonas sp.]|uniref:flagellar hook-associated protein FlgL n=1 Tax=Nitrosomonas sp. TaxID=42353 RepID=UPI000E8FBC6D|nr:flagellar hook-associated protein FlgL [Nitrosomonas sp.]GJL75511.1 MAG: flagellar hook-associated protein 3 [Nitrosomonas sp.]HBV20491.1 flagellar hook-associated protein 3 [Nitrosomonas sp.]HNP26356.1 flagellar hook-associated protein FlgL [Nitrosomonas sp.]